MLRYTRNKSRKESISAKLIEKKEGEYFAIPGKVPNPEAFYELINLKIKFIKMKKLEVQKGAKPLSPNIKDYCVAIILAFC